MSKSPLITSILTIPGFGASIQRTGTILAGIVIDDSRIAWGSCEEFKDDDPGFFQPAFLVDEGITTIEASVFPCLVGQGLTNFRELASGLESIREKVTVSKTIPLPERQSQGISRREIITGFLSSSEADTAPALEEQVTVERPVHPAIRFGLSQALLSAVSMVQGITETEVIAKEFELPLPSKVVPLQMPIKRGQSLGLNDQVSALAYTIRGTDPADSLGIDGERIQRFIRQLRERLVEAGQHKQITIHLDARGSYGRLYGDNLGKILGALHGLEQAASPCHIRVQDPLIMEDLDDQIKVMGQLRDYLRIRVMSLKLAAGARINTLDDVRPFTRAGSAHMLHLVMPRLGTIQELINSVQACQEGGVEIVMEGAPSSVTSQVALAAQPDILTFPPDLPGGASAAAFHNEMARTLSWLASKGLISPL